MTTISENKVISKATFNPKLKTYIFLVVLFYLFITIIGWVLIPFWIFGLGQWLSGKFFNTLKCELSEKHLYFSKGIIIFIEKTIPLENIQDLSFIGGPVLRSFGLTMIKVETAGGGGNSHTNMMSIPGINEAEKFKQMILEQRERIILQKTTGKHAPNEINDNRVLLEIKEELVAIKKILSENKN